MDYSRKEYSRNSVDWDKFMNTFLNGMIFVVDSQTYSDVVKNHLFGLPASYLKEMKLLRPGQSALFFFERNTHTLSGIFTSTAEAELNINTKIWTRRDGQCKFPAQIRWRMVAELPTIPKSHPKLPRFVQNMKIKGKFLEHARLKELLNGYRAALYGSSPQRLNPYLTQRPKQRNRKRTPQEGEVTENRSTTSSEDSYQRRSANESADWEYRQADSNDYHKPGTYASPEMGPTEPAAEWRNYNGPGDDMHGHFGLDYESPHISHYNPIIYDRRAELAQRAINEFNRKLRKLGFYMNNTAFDDEGQMVKNPRHASRRGYGGARHRPLFVSKRDTQPREQNDFWPEDPYYHDATVCY